MNDETPSFAVVQYAAMSFLAMREHSAHELRQKLHKRFPIWELVTEVVNELAARDLQSDERFASAFVVMRKRQGKGPIRILYELKEKGISLDVASCLVDPNDELWVELAQEVCAKRFGNGSSLSPKEKARQLRFLQYRGFNSTQIHRALT